MPRFRFKTTQGFSMMELLVVLVIVSLVIATVLPRIGAGWKRMEEREFLSDFLRTVASARLLAMNSGKVASFRIRGGTDRLYGLDDPPEKPIPLNVDVYADDLEQDPDTGDHLISFYPDGSPSATKLEVVFDRERSFFLNIHPLTGTAWWVRME